MAWLVLVSAWLLACILFFACLLVCLLALRLTFGFVWVLFGLAWLVLAFGLAFALVSFGSVWRLALLVLWLLAKIGF